MAAEGIVVYKTKDVIVAEFLAALLARIPDASTGPDSIFRMLYEIDATGLEGVYLSQQLLHDDIFPQTASALALNRFGDQFGRPRKSGVAATGTARFSGVGGTFIASGTEVGAPRPALGDVLLFSTVTSGTIPNPGTPTAPTAADHGSGSSLAAGTYEYGISFQTTEGETELGAISNALVMATSHSIDLTAISLGGAGTIGRRIYRRVNGGAFGHVYTIADNSTTTYTDAVSATTTLPLSTSTAEQLTLPVQADEVGADYNVTIGSISSITSGDSALSGVTNAVTFIDGEDQEDIEVFRQELIKHIANPQSGSADDLVSWATEIDGIGSAAVFRNVNLAGTTTLGTVTVRVAGPNGSLPSSDLIAQVQTYLLSKDLANITILVGSFTANPIDVTIATTLHGSYALGDVTPQATAAITDYINSVPVGGTVRVAGIYAAVFGLSGIDTLSVTTPSTDQTSTATQKPTAGTITVG
jgi:uncharacterized phage protein gp47/JayE